MEGMRPDGNCRTCMVEIKGERVLAPSCCRYPKDGMEVTTNSARAVTSQKMSLELLLSDMPETRLHAQLRARSLGEEAGGRQAALRSRGISRPQDLSHPAMAVQPRRLHPVHALRARLPRRAGQRRHRLRVPRRALEDRVRPRRSDGRLDVRRLRRVRAGVPDRRADAGARRRHDRRPTRQVDSVCPYCGVGCQLTYNVKDNKILFVQGKDGPANSSRLCVKGRYGFDYVQHKHRLTKPLIRKPGVPKHKDFTVDPDNWQRRVPRSDVGRSARLSRPRDCATIRDTLRQAVARRLRLGEGHATKRRICSRSWCAPASASNNVDHCTRLCHASSVAALMEGINSGAVSNQVRDVANAEVIFVIGANPTVEPSGRRDLDEERRQSAARS